MLLLRTFALNTIALLLQNLVLNPTVLLLQTLVLNPTTLLMHPRCLPERLNGPKRTCRGVLHRWKQHCGVMDTELLMLRLQKDQS